MNLYGTIDLGAYFGAEVRVIDGEEYICIPRRFNPTIRFFGGHPNLLLDLNETKKPDDEGFTHLCLPHIPWEMLKTLPEADYIKMTNPVGKFKVLAPKKPEKVPEEPKNIGYETLAASPVKDTNIPL